MKIRLELTVEVDPADWNRSYGTGTDAKAVREDVQAWMRGAAIDHPEGLITLVRA